MAGQPIARRTLLARMGTGAALAGAGALTPFSLAHAATDRRLVVAVLRGGMDGLAAVPPYADPDYAETRGALALAEPGSGDGAIDLDGRFGLHPALGPLADLYRQKELVVIHAAATPYRERSHFDAQDMLENGTVRPHGARDGWLNRALGLMGASDTRLGLAVGQSMPLILRGEVPVGSWAPHALPGPGADFLDRLSVLYRDDPVLGPALGEGLRAQAMSDDVLGGRKKMERGGNPAAALRATVEAVGKLLASADGPRIAVFDLGGWDTHANQGLHTGRMANTLKALGEGIAALKQGLGPGWDKTAVVLVTEFGRTAAPNGTNGTDHGTAGAAFLLGGAVAGGRVVARWPGLGPDRLYQGRDLAPTTDLRSIFKAVLVDHMGLPAGDVEARVFPGSAAAARERGLFRA